MPNNIYGNYRKTVPRAVKNNKIRAVHKQIVNVVVANAASTYIIATARGAPIAAPIAAAVMPVRASLLSLLCVAERATLDVRASVVEKKRTIELGAHGDTLSS